MDQSGYLLICEGGRTFLLSDDDRKALKHVLVAYSQSYVDNDFVPTLAPATGPLRSPRREGDKTWFAPLDTDRLMDSMEAHAKRDMCHMMVRISTVDEEARRRLYERYPDMQRYKPDRRRALGAERDHGMRELSYILKSIDGWPFIRIAEGAVVRGIIYFDS